MQRSTQAPTAEQERALPGLVGNGNIQEEGCKMKIEVLYMPHCPNHALALERLRGILSAESFQKQVSEILVRDAVMAQSLKFPGSPTIRINGQDVEPQSEKAVAFGLMCRLYSDGSGAPSRQKLRAAIEEAQSSKAR